MVSIIVAFIAGILALFQVRTNIISASRIRWINEFRERLSEYAVELTKGLLFYYNHINEMKNQGLEIFSKQDDNYLKYIESVHNLSKVSFIIDLYLDSKNNQLHKDLKNKISDINKSIKEFFRKKPSEIIEIDKFRENIAEELPRISDIAKEIIEIETKKTRKLFVFK